MGIQRHCALIRYLAVICCSGVLGVCNILGWLSLFEDAVTQQRRDLLDATLFPPCITRHYVFSKADQMVPYQCVQQHATKAIELFGKQRIVLREYTDSGHVAHAKVHGKVYWRDLHSLITPNTPLDSEKVVSESEKAVSDSVISVNFDEKSPRTTYGTLSSPTTTEK